MRWSLTTGSVEKQVEAMNVDGVEALNVVANNPNSMRSCIARSCMFVSRKPSDLVCIM